MQNVGENTIKITLVCKCREDERIIENKVEIVALFISSPKWVIYTTIHNCINNQLNIKEKKQHF